MRQVLDRRDETDVQGIHKLASRSNQSINFTIVSSVWSKEEALFDDFELVHIPSLFTMK